MSKEADLIQIYNDEKREFEYFVKGCNITKSIKVLLKAHKEAYDTERRIFCDIKSWIEAEEYYDKALEELKYKPIQVANYIQDNTYCYAKVGNKLLHIEKDKFNEIIKQAKDINNESNNYV